MKKIILSLLLVIIVYALQAQKYGAAVGVRLGESSFGISAKQRIVSKFSLEGIADFQSNSYQLTILPKLHLPITGEGFNLYFGAGMHKGKGQELGSNYGYDLVGGVEWKIPALPVVLGADVKPSYNINQSNWFDFPATVSIHYVLSKETKAKRKKVREKRIRRKERRQERRENRNESRSQRLDNFY